MRERRFSRTAVVITIALIQWLGWTKISGGIATTVASQLFPPYLLSGGYDWVLPPGVPAFAVLLRYGLSLCGLAVTWAICALVYRRALKVGDDTLPYSFKAFVSISGTVLAINLLTTTLEGSQAFLLWLLPIIWACAPVRHHPRAPGVFAWFGEGLPIIILAILTGGMLLPHTISGAVFKNDYLAVPTTTLLKSGPVDSLAFINAHRIEALQIYDYRTGKIGNAGESDGFSIVTTRGPVIDYLLLTKPYVYSWDESQQRLWVKGPLPEEDLKTATGAPQSNSVEGSAIYDLYLRSNRADYRFQRRSFTKDEIEFANKNRYELLSAVQLGRCFYHHQYFFAPILAHNLGIDFSTMPVQYGYGSSLVFAKVLAAQDATTFDGYFQLFFGVYLFYIAVALACAWRMIPQRAYFALICLGLALSIILPSFENILQAPGYNPLRHLFDFAVFVAVFQFGRTRSLFALLAAVGLSVLSVWWSKEFGLFIAFGTGCAFAGIGLMNREARFRAWAGAVFLAIGTAVCIAALSSLTGANPLFKYALIGMGVPVLGRMNSLLILAAIGSITTGVIAWLYLWRSRFKNDDMALVAVIIATGAFVVTAFAYVIWNPGFPHFAPLAPATLLFVACTVRLFVTTSDAPRFVRSLPVFIASAMMLLALPPTFQFFSDWLVYNRSTSDHTIYRWNMDMAHFRTTMNPEPFSLAVGLIRKYSQDPSIVLISRYSHILPSLARKYNAIGLPELESTLVTPHERDIVLDSIERAKPRYIFADTNIEMGLNGEAADPESLMFTDESSLAFAALGRVRALTTIRTLFHHIEPNYHLIEKGPVISVYERNS